MKHLPFMLSESSETTETVDNSSATHQVTVKAANSDIPMKVADLRFSVLNMVAPKEKPVLTRIQHASEFVSGLLKFSTTGVFLLATAISVLEIHHPGSTDMIRFKLLNHY